MANDSINLIEVIRMLNDGKRFDYVNVWFMKDGIVESKSFADCNFGTAIFWARREESIEDSDVRSGLTNVCNGKQKKQQEASPGATPLPKKSKQQKEGKYFE